MAKKRSIKVYGQSGYKYHETPTIMLKGMWLKELGFDIGDYISVDDEPNPEMTSFIFRETLMTHLLLWGNSYSQIIRNGKGEIVTLYVPCLHVCMNRKSYGEQREREMQSISSLLMMEEVLMIDEWSGLADMSANLIEKYASDSDIENLPDIAGDNHAKDDRNKAEGLSKN